MERKGDYTGTFSGMKFWVLDPKVEEVTIDDIVHPLSQICRFNGHTKYFYSVAQHCLGVYELLKRWGLSPKVQLYGLLHDAGEAYFCDMPSPIKGYIPTYKDIEKNLERTIYFKFGLTVPMRLEKDYIKEADNAMLANESHALMRNIEGWDLVSISDDNKIKIKRRPKFWVRYQFKKILKQLCIEVTL